MKFKLVVLVALLISASSCDKKAEKIQELSEKEILKKVIDQSGQRLLSQAALSFAIDDITYKATRNGHLYKYEMRQERDAVLYEAIAYNGGFEYTENSIPNNNTVVKWQVERQLAFILNFVMLPTLFEKDNSVELYKEGVEQINEQSYYVLHIYNKSKLPSDLIYNYHLYQGKRI